MYVHARMRKECIQWMHLYVHAHALACMHEWLNNTNCIHMHNINYKSTIAFALKYFIYNCTTLNNMHDVLVLDLNSIYKHIDIYIYMYYYHLSNIASHARTRTRIRMHIHTHNPAHTGTESITCMHAQYTDTWQFLTFRCFYIAIYIAIRCNK